MAKKPVSIFGLPRPVSPPAKPDTLEKLIHDASSISLGDVFVHAMQKGVRLYAHSLDGERGFDILGAYGEYALIRIPEDKHIDPPWPEQKGIHVYGSSIYYSLTKKVEGSGWRYT